MPGAVKMLPPLPRGNAAQRRFTLEGNWGGVTTLAVTITKPAGVWSCRVKWRSNTLLHVTANLVRPGPIKGDTDNIDVTITNSTTGAAVASGTGLQIAYADDADP